MMDVRDLLHPIIQAPMAGGPSTPELAAAVSEAGGLGFLAAGYRSAQDVRDQIARTRELTSAPFGVNLLVPPPPGTPSPDLTAYAAELQDDARRFDTELGEPRFDDDDWDAKLGVLLELQPALASFAFGAPTHEQVQELRGAGVAVALTVTSLAESREALARGADILILQGPGAGGHRGVWDQTAPAGTESLSSLLDALRPMTELPIVACGGIGTAHHIDHARRFGADAVQLGTAFLLADEAGTNAVHRAVVGSPDFTETVVTRAFTGRWARGVANAFTRAHDRTAPIGYPQVHHLTRPIRAASVERGDPDFTSLWAGTAFGFAAPGSAQAIVTRLVEGDLG